MTYCDHCGKEIKISYGYHSLNLCEDCYREIKKNDIIRRGCQVLRASDLKDWDSGDLSELFWIHLGRYVKTPNEDSLTHIRQAFCWACHADRGLASSFANALKWTNIDLYKEEKRWSGKDS